MAICLMRMCAGAILGVWPTLNDYRPTQCLFITFSDMNVLANAVDVRVM